MKRTFVRFCGQSANCSRLVAIMSNVTALLRAIMSDDTARNDTALFAVVRIEQL